MNSKTILELVDLIYASVQEPPRWNDFMERLTDASRGTSMVFFRQDVSRPGAAVPLSVRIEESFRNSYETYYNSVNPWMSHRPELLVPGRVATSEEMCPTDVLRRSEYYNDWLKPQGYAHCLGGMVLREGPLNSVITAFRSLRSGPARESDLRVFQTILPHLQRGVQLYFRLLDVETGQAATMAALDRLSMGIILVNARAQPIFINRAALGILAEKDGLTLTPAGIRAARSQDNAALARLIAEATATGEGRADENARGSGGALGVQRPSLKRPLSILVTPLHPSQYRLGREPATVAVFVSDPEREISSDEEVLRRLHGFTSAEAALALQLMSGRSLQEAADALSITKNTARVQLKSVFMKAGVRRQAELIKVLLVGSAFLRAE